MILNNKTNNNRGEFLELLATAKNAIIRYPAGYRIIE